MIEQNELGRLRKRFLNVILLYLIEEEECTCMLLQFIIIADFSEFLEIRLVIISYNKL